MSIVYAEGFDDGAMRGTPLTNFANFPTVTTGNPRTGTRSLACQGLATTRSSYYQINFPAALTTGWLYFSINLPVTTFRFAQLYDGATEHLRLDLRADGKFEVTRAGTALTGGVGTFIYTPGTHVSLAMKWTIHDTTGTFELRINGSATPDINVSGADTRNGATAQVTIAYLGQVTTAGAIGVTYIDDIVVQDTAGSAPENTWLGDVECNYQFPNAAGDESDFTIAGSAPAATRHESLDEVPYDDGVTYVESNTPGDQLLMGYGDLSGSGTIYAVIPVLRATKASAGARSIAPREKLGSTVRNGGDIALTTSQVTYQGTVWHRDPDGNVWTTANFNSSQGGAEVTV